MSNTETKSVASQERATEPTPEPENSNGDASTEDSASVLIQPPVLQQTYRPKPSVAATPTQSQPQATPAPTPAPTETPSDTTPSEETPAGDGGLIDLPILEPLLP